MRATGPIFLAFSAILLAACADAPQALISPYDAGGSSGSGADLAPPPDLAQPPDEATADEASADGAAADEAIPVDAATQDLAEAPDEASGGDDAGVVTCTSAGGSCVALTPTSCPAPGVIGDANHYSCGGGLGVECCLPGTATPGPTCMHQGTASEGWYDAGGTLLCQASCAGLAAPKCERVGTSAQGWYTSSGSGCPPYSTLIVHDANCSP